MNIAPKLTAQLDASPHIISDWRNFFKFRSIQWSLGGFVIAFINSVVLAAGAIPFQEAVGGLAMWIMVALVFLGSMYSRLRVQPTLPPAE